MSVTTYTVRYSDGTTYTTNDATAALGRARQAGAVSVSADTAGEVRTVWTPDSERRGTGSLIAAACQNEATPRTERVTVAELAAGDVLVHSSGAMDRVGYVGPVERIGPRSYRYVSAGTTSGSWRTSNRYDRLTPEAKAAAGYPTAEHDVPSAREERECVIGAQDVAALRRALDGDGDLPSLVAAILDGLA